MKSIIQRISGTLVLILCCLSLTIILPACDSSSTNITNVPTHIATTPAPPLPFTAYGGNGFSLSFPKGWNMIQNNQLFGVPGDIVTFSDQTNLMSFTVGRVANANGNITASQFVDTLTQGLKSQTKQYQEVTTDPTVTVGGQSWNQKAATTDLTTKGGSENVKSVLLACNYPAQTASTMLYYIVYTSPTPIFDHSTQSYFQPTLQSFKFV